MIRVGFVPLLDAAPLVMAQELGYFAAERLSVVLQRQIGWANVRDKLVYGHLQASHALVGMPPASVLGRERFAEPVVAVMGLGSGGNAITVSRRLADAGVNAAGALAAWLRQGFAREKPVFAHVFGCSMHHYLLRDWLAAGGLDPDRDVQLCVLPPVQMTGQVASGSLDGFCVGEPWNTAAERTGVGRIVAATTDVLPDHPEKVLAVNRRWLAGHHDAAAGLVRAILRACLYCHDKANAATVAETLARPEYLDVPAELLAAALARSGTAPTFDPGHTFPSATHAAWVLGQMKRWGHSPPGADLLDAARRSIDAGPYRAAAQSLNLPCPGDDLPPMRVKRGWFTPTGAGPTMASAL